MKYNFDNIEFSSKEKIYRYVREKLDTIGAGTYDCKSEPYIFLLNLLKKHSDIEKIISSGISSFTIEYAYGWHIIYKRFDGVENDFSWRRCCGVKKEKNQKYKLLEAMRSKIRDDIAEYKKQHPTCEKCEEYKTSEIHHIVSFKILSTEFIKNYEYKIPLEFIENSLSINHFKPKSKFGRLWLEYHRQKAQLMALCYNCHKKIHT